MKRLKLVYAENTAYLATNLCAHKRHACIRQYNSMHPSDRDIPQLQADKRKAA